MFSLLFYFSCFFLAALTVKAWLTGPLFDCLRGWDQGVLCQRPDEDPAPGASESRTLSQITCNSETPLLKSITSPPLLVFLRQIHAAFQTAHYLLSSEQARSHVGEKKKKARRCLRSWKWYPDGFKDWVQIMCIPASLTGFCNFLQMRPFEVNWSQGCGMPCTFIARVTKDGGGRERQLPCPTTEVFTVCCTALNHIPLWRMLTAGTRATTEAVGVTCLLAQWNKQANWTVL